MLDLALSLVSDPTNVGVVLVILALAIVIRVFTRRLPTAAKDTIYFIAGLTIVVVVMIYGAYKAPHAELELPSQLLVAKDMGPVPITRPGATAELEEVTSLKGWGEGEDGPINGGTVLRHGRHADNIDGSHTPLIFDRVLSLIGRRGMTGEQMAALTQTQWEAFLVGLGQRGRREISSIPFARIRLRASDGHERRVILFRYDAERVQDGFGRDEVTVCALRVFNIRESATRGSEAIYLGVGNRGCPNPGRRGIEIEGENAR